MEILKEILTADVPGVQIGEVSECGAGTCWVIVRELKEEGYERYLKEAKDRGFVQKARKITDRGNASIAIFRKDDLILTATFYPYMFKAYFSASRNLLGGGEEDGRIFDDLPALDSLGGTADDVMDFGAGNYVVAVCGTGKADYEAYLERLSDAGFTKYADNGSGLDGSVFNAVYVKKDLAVTVTHAEKLEKTYVSACRNLPLSKHLIHRKEYAEGCVEGARTTLHLMEMWQYFGNSFVIQLKNGHFIVSDGGFYHETGYLLDYLESLAPENEKPVIEAWFISHAHTDHCAVLRPFTTNPEYCDRIYVEGIYYNEPCDCVVALDCATRDDITFIHMAAECMRTSEGGHPAIYRPQTGQRYYFCDITVDILMAQEQLTFEKYSGDFNDSTTWCLFTIEGQKCLLGGDGDTGGMRFIMGAYNREFLDFDVFSVLHHGHNSNREFTDYCKIKTCLFTKRGEPPAYKKEENQHLREVSREWIVWDDGTKVLTFPYEIGTARCLPGFDWIYHKGQERKNP